MMLELSTKVLIGSGMLLDWLEDASQSWQHILQSQRCTHAKRV